MGNNEWVSPREDGKWGVHGECSKKDSNVFDNKVDAIARAKEIAKNKEGELIIQKRNGKIQSKDSYGNDPCPPKDKEY